MDCLIYRIRSIKDPRMVYIGSSKDNNKYIRFGSHIMFYGKWKETGTGIKISLYDMFDKYGVESCFIEVLENLHIDKGDDKLNTKELRRYEGLYQLEYRDNPYYNMINKKIDYYGNDKRYSSSKEYDRHMRIKHRTQKLAYKKKYYQLNKEKSKIYAREYRKQNREEINKKDRVKVNCPHCDKLLSKGSLRRHIRKLHPNPDP